MWSSSVGNDGAIEWAATVTDWLPNSLGSLSKTDNSEMASHYMKAIVSACPKGKGHSRLLEHQPQRPHSQRTWSRDAYESCSPKGRAARRAGRHWLNRRKYWNNYFEWSSLYGKHLSQLTHSLHYMDQWFMCKAYNLNLNLSAAIKNSITNYTPFSPVSLVLVFHHALLQLSHAIHSLLCSHSCSTLCLCTGSPRAQSVSLNAPLRSKYFSRSEKHLNARIQTNWLGSRATCA